MTAMICKEYSIHFTTPAFLGDAEQKAAWRTPPFKTLIRQWWRVAVAQELNNYDVEQLRDKEAQLFGSAADSKNKSSGQSKLKIRLSHWNAGTMNNWNSTGKIKHPEVKFPVGSDLYLAYGPVEYRRGAGSALKKPPAIAVNTTNTLKLKVPDSSIVDAMQLISWFGTLGGRSRNAWGSLAVEEGELQGLELLLDGKADLSHVSSSLANCLRSEWAHSLGKDAEGLLIWKTNPKNNWEQVIKELAEVKVAFRTCLEPGKSGQFAERHLLAYPVTHHKVHRWERLTNQVRFKVVSFERKFYGLVFHLPCKPPIKMIDLALPDQIDIWSKVHNKLDETLTRLGGIS